MIRIAVDGMGGDYAPQVVVEGAVAAANDFADLEIILVGQPEALKRELNKHKVLGGKIDIHPASEVVDMGDSPVASLRKKKDSSISVCINLLKEKKVDAVMTAGNTGAAVAASTLMLGLLALEIEQKHLLEKDPKWAETKKFLEQNPIRY